MTPVFIDGVGLYAVSFCFAQVTTDDAFQTADADQNGEISLAEFRAWFSTKSSEGMQSLLSAQAPGLQDDSDDTTDSDSTSSSSDAGSGEVVRVRHVSCLWRPMSI